MKVQYLTVKDASKAIGYSLQHVRLLIRLGKIDAKKLGRDWLIECSALDRFRKSRHDSSGQRNG